MAQYALDRVLSVAGSDAITGNVVFLADQVVDPALSFTSETEDIVDAMNNVVMVLENGRGATFSASNAFFNTQILAAQVGGEVTGSSETIKREMLAFDESATAKLAFKPVNNNVKVYRLAVDTAIPEEEMTDVGYNEGTNSVYFIMMDDYDPGASYIAVYTVKNAVTTTFTKYEILPVVDMKATLTYASNHDANGYFIGDVYELSDDGSLTSATAINKENVTHEAGAMGYPDAIIIHGDTQPKKVLVVYEATVVVDEAITAYADAKNRLMNVTAEVLLRDLCKEELYYAYIIMRGKLSGEAEWSMTRDGNHPFEIRCFPEYCGDKKLVDVIIVKGNE